MSDFRVPTLTRRAFLASAAALLLSRVRLQSGAGELIMVVLKVALAAIVCGVAALLVTQALHGVTGIATGVIVGAMAYALTLRLLAAVPGQDATVIDRLLSRLPAGIGRIARLFFSFIAPLPAAPQVPK